MELPQDPIERFAVLYEQAKKAIPVDPNAMIVSSVGAEGRPSSRVVLLKDFDARGFVFFTNLTSRKGHELLGQPFAALVFYWAPLERQIRIEGRVERVSEEESNAYFQSRARGSQVGAWASLQSQPLPSRELLEARVDAVTKQYEGSPVPRPPHWAGLRVVPDRIEFWHARPSRLHERLVYLREDGAWHTELLYP
ncbi:pyridoxamine 5'-phosphate oxidase [Stigmatella sp. ncwal1]|uniref:Pyridoxamine 5'-phosphate oxidase n=1 Tax=Stigmatella ashevillensis TaxID=2995309 RepID=A0ABT5DMZ1_9BACT|nr:pyridoxamine 5'-phosphate oxidase [Stigmatella ashevillena]MDC0713731.1 pyridoxamine 5'-phosphate oxidase [Stigmatella ashevillena]